MPQADVADLWRVMGWSEFGGSSVSVPMAST
jgi:hypothetical protein